MPLYTPDTSHCRPWMCNSQTFPVMYIPQSELAITAALQPRHKMTALFWICYASTQDPTNEYSNNAISQLAMVFSWVSVLQNG